MSRRRYPFLHRRGRMLHFFWRDEHGHRREESTRTADPELAEERYRLRMAEIRSGQTPNDLSHALLEQAVQVWLEYRQNRVAVGTLNQLSLRMFILFGYASGRMAALFRTKHSDTNPRN